MTKDLTRDERETAALQSARDARGLFVRADQLAVLRYYLQRHETYTADAGRGLVSFVSSLLDQHGIGPIETRPARPVEPGYTVEESERHPAVQCSQCGGPSADFGGGYRECRACGHEFLMVAREDTP